MKEALKHSGKHGRRYESMEYNTMCLDEKAQYCKDVSYS